jgi:hypothetical protein
MRNSLSPTRREADRVRSAWRVRSTASGVVGDQRAGCGSLCVSRIQASNCRWASSRAMP